MPTVRQVLAWKIGLSLLILLPLLFFPGTYLPWVGIPADESAALVFVRLLGAAYGALAVVEAWGLFVAAGRREALLAGLADTVGIALLLWHFVYSGHLAAWPAAGKAVVTAAAAVASIFAIGLLATGYGVLLRGAGAAGSVAGSDGPPRADSSPRV